MSIKTITYTQFRQHLVLNGKTVTVPTWHVAMLRHLKGVVRQRCSDSLYSVTKGDMIPVDDIL